VNVGDALSTEGNKLSRVSCVPRNALRSCNTAAMAPAQDNSREERAITDLANEISERLAIEGRMQRYIESAGISMTPHARLMLLLPLAELNFTEDIRQYEQASQSLNRLIETMASAPAKADTEDQGRSARNGGKMRSARSVIKAFWREFCRIPPFCGENEPEIRQ
jgi:hypothetical protein